MGRFTEQVIKELSDIRQELAVKNVILERLTETVEKHEQRSTQLEARIVPVEQHVSLVRGIFKFGASVVTFFAGIAGIYKYLISRT